MNNNFLNFNNLNNYQINLNNQQKNNINYESFKKESNKLFDLGFNTLLYIQTKVTSLYNNSNCNNNFNNNSNNIQN